MTNTSPIHHHGSCCHTPEPSPHIAKKISRMDKVIAVLEKVSLVAIGIFSAMTAIKLFVPSFALGLVIGLWDGTKSCEKPHSHQDHALCAHGFMEHLTGVKLPKPLALAANVAILVAHVDHHAPVFVPIVGVTMGIWAGRATAPALDLCCKKFAAFVKEPFVRHKPHHSLVLV